MNDSRFTEIIIKKLLTNANTIVDAIDEACHMHVFWPPKIDAWQRRDLNSIRTQIIQIVYKNPVVSVIASCSHLSNRVSVMFTHCY